MTRPTTARLQTAYDLGHREGYPPPANIANDPELMAAFDDGVSDTEDGRPATKPERPKPAVGAAPKRAPAKKRPPAAPAKTPTRPAAAKTAPPSRPRALARSTRDTFSKLPSPSLSPAGWGDAGGFAFGLLLYVWGVNFLRYGPAGVRGWFAAKFLNKPMTAAALASAARNPGTQPTAPASPGYRDEPVTLALVAPRPVRSA